MQRQIRLSTSQQNFRPNHQQTDFFHLRVTQSQLQPERQESEEGDQVSPGIYQHVRYPNILGIGQKRRQKHKQNQQFLHNYWNHPYKNKMAKDQILQIINYNRYGYSQRVRKVKKWRHNNYNKSFQMYLDYNPLINSYSPNKFFLNRQNHIKHIISFGSVKIKKPMKTLYIPQCFRCKTNSKRKHVKIMAPRKIARTRSQNVIAIKARKQKQLEDESKKRSMQFKYRRIDDLPTEKEQKMIRRKLFKFIDDNGNGYLSHLEIRQGVKDIIDIKAFTKENWRRGWNQAIAQAFHLATASAKAKGLKNSDFLQIHQFRRLLLALKQYFEYYDIYTKIDENSDKKLSFEEFRQIGPSLEKWGGKIDNLSSIFDQIDTDGSGEIDFEEFCKWAIQRSFLYRDLANDDQNELTRKERKRLQRLKKSRSEHGKAIKILNSLPTDEDQKQKRQELFRKIDNNGNGLLSILEVRQGIWDILGETSLMKWHRGWKSAIMKSFNNATRSARAQRLQNCEYLQVHQFRRLLLALKQYFEFYITYLEIDDNNDKQLSFSEFKLASPMVEKWAGKIESLEVAFKKIDQDQSGTIDFDEFCDWAIKRSFKNNNYDLDDINEQVDPHWRKMLKQKQSIKRRKSGAYGNLQSSIQGKKLKSKSIKFNSPADFPTFPSDMQIRKQIFRRVDENGNGFLSILEIRSGMNKILSQNFLKRYKHIWKKAIKSSFDLATRSAKDKKLQSDFLQLHQFRRLLLALKQYFEYFDIYTRIDVNSDKALSLEEFKKSAPIIRKWVGEIQSLEKAFHEIDADKSGEIDFEELCQWAIKKSFDVSHAEKDDVEENPKQLISEIFSSVTKQNLEMNPDISRKFFVFKEMNF